MKLWSMSPKKMIKYQIDRIFEDTRRMHQYKRKSYEYHKSVVETIYRRVKE